jgi:hypothetical protein
VKDTDIIAAIAPDAVSLMDKAIAEIKRLRQENATLTAEHDALRAERDEARRECRLLLLGQEVLRGVRDLPAPPDDLVTIVPVPRKEDGVVGTASRRTPMNDTSTIVALALTNVLTDIWHEQHRHKDIASHPEEFRQFCESVLYSALSKEKQ